MKVLITAVALAAGSLAYAGGATKVDCTKNPSAEGCKKADTASGETAAPADEPVAAEESWDNEGVESEDWGTETETTEPTGN